MASTVDGCVELMRALVPDFAPAELESLEEVEVGVAWLDHARPARPRARRGRGGAVPAQPRDRLPARRRGENRLFMREVADVHRGLFPENADAYGDNVRAKLERCLEVTDAEVGGGAARARRVPRALRRRRWTASICC